MGVLDAKKAEEAGEVKKKKKPSGYNRVLFEDHRMHKTDDRMFGGDMDKKESVEHDQKVAEKIVNGMCVDFFFRAEDIDNPKFKNIPDSNTPVPESERRPQATGKITTKPLDSGKHNRSYIIGTEPEQPAPKFKSSRKKRNLNKRRAKVRGRRVRGPRARAARGSGSQGARGQNPRARGGKAQGAKTSPKAYKGQNARVYRKGTKANTLKQKR